MRGLIIVCRLTLGLFLVGLIAACNGSSDSDAPPTTGDASLAVTDAPVDGVSRVKLTFDRIELKPANGEKVTVELDPAVTIENLLELTGDASQTVMGTTTVPAGDYNYVRLYVQGGSPDSEVEEDSGGVFDLLLPGQQAGAANRFIQLVSGFTVPAGGDADFTIDIDLRKALTKPTGQEHYLLRPAVRIVNNVEVGTIRGSVDEALFADSGCTNDVAADEGVAVYLYDADVPALGDVNVDANGDPDHGSDDSDAVLDEKNPITTAAVTQNIDTGEYEYVVGFVREGAYRLGLTCQSLDDLPGSDEDIGFLQDTDLSVVAGQTTEINFTAAVP